MIPAPDINWIAILPELILGLGAAVVLLVDVQWKPAPKRLAQLGFSILVLAGAATLWQRAWLFGLTEADLGRTLPFAGMVVVDPYAIFARLVLVVVSLLGLGAAWRFLEGLGRRAAEALALLLLATAGFSLMAVTPNLVMIFLGLEIGSISLYVLAGFGRQEARSDEAAIKYFLLGSFASAIFIYGVALIFAGTGSLDLFDQRTFLSGVILVRPAVLLIGLGLVVVGLAFKVTAAPFHSWAPDVYEGAPAGAVGFMAAAAKVGGFAALTRILVTAFDSYADEWTAVIGGIAALSMAVGSLLAVAQEDMRRLLAYSGVAHAGFILTGLMAGRAGTSTVWFYLAVYTVQLLGAFAVVSAVSGPASAGSLIARYQGLGRRQPVLALGLTVLLLGMAGIPLTSGFVAKFGVFQEAWRAGFSWLVIVAVLASVIAFFLYLRVIVTMYMGETTMGETGTEELASPPTPVKAVLGVAVLSTLVFGILPGPLLDLAADALPF
ncbi:MAG TPA: NADH-quinone oxidoreductase subunit N [Acidimicrobiia bacterium]|nr:NADH-quinone oxidoreductase subunit N [Acidimicrobiia bacterium]